VTRSDLTGTIFNIQRYAIHDGPGIRTTVFLKGCPLSCTWCHNPEGLAREPEVLVVTDRCAGCGGCVEVCPNPPIERPDGRIVTDRASCIRCGRCVLACAAGARRMSGRNVTVEEVLDEVERDRPFYEESQGGVTFSGGEPLMQGEFLMACLEGCRGRALRTAVDTSGCAERELVLEVARLADLFLYDLKVMDEERHREFTGAELRPILENLRALDANGVPVEIRFPLIPGVTDDASNLEALGAFVASLGHTRVVHVLPFHRTAADKYTRLDRSWGHGALEAVPQEGVGRATRILAASGLDVQTGG